MKKIIMVMLLSIVTISIASALQKKIEARAETRKEIVLEEVSMPSGPVPRTKLTNAWIIGNSIVTVQFNYLLGNANVELLDWSGNTISTTSCNTDNQEFVNLNVNLTEGMYTIRITAKEYEAKGNIYVPVN